MDEWIELNEIAKEIHENAVAHGWWEEDRPGYEIIALIHSEWSEALEEYRNGRPMVYESEGGKPEGVAVELIDGVIRILDYIVSSGETHQFEIAFSEQRRPIGIPELVAHLHDFTSRSWSLPDSDGMYIDASILMVNVDIVFGWVDRHGLDPLEILNKKHEYNKTRPYRHGGKVC